MTAAIITGGRAYTKRERLYLLLDLAVKRLGVDTIITGGCGKRDANGRAIMGADILAEEWALGRGDICIISCPVTDLDWEQIGNSAGPQRNETMARIGAACDPPAKCLAFPGGRGTANMKSAAARHGLEIIEVH